jgi:hypothetical protein
MPEKIGDFLVRINEMSRDQVNKVLRLQQSGDKRRFGDIALELGYIGDNSLKRYVDYLEKVASAR